MDVRPLTGAVAGNPTGSDRAETALVDWLDASVCSSNAIWALPSRTQANRNSSLKDGGREP
jgi:hypothetical protein